MITFRWKTLLLVITLQGILIFALAAYVRHSVRAQLLARQTAVLKATAELEFTQVYETSGKDLADAITAVVSRAALLEGMVGAEVYDNEGRQLLTVPDQLQTEITPEQQRGSQYLAESNLFTGLSPAPVVVTHFALEHPAARELSFRFWSDGAPFSQAFAQLDQRIFGFATIATLVSGTLLACVFSFLSRNLQRQKALLTVRSRELLAVNRDLLLESKTSALGALASHLVHDLKNLIGELRQALKRGQSDEAEETAVRMQQALQDITFALRHEGEVSASQLTAAEVIEMVESRLEKSARKAGVTLECSSTSEAHLAFRSGNIAALILQNLGHNAIEASILNSTVQITSTDTDEASILFQVADVGSGIPTETLQQIFTQNKTAKPNGTGLGLPLCAQMARRIHADLNVLQSSPEEGTVIQLTVPLSDKTPSPVNPTLYPA